MNAQAAILNLLDTAEMIGLGYVKDLSDTDLMRRPHSNCNHINWQIGHLVVGEHQMIGQISPNPMPALPPGFAERYVKEKSKSDNPEDFCRKDVLLNAYRQQRAATKTALATFDEAALDRSTGVDYAPTIGKLFSLQGSHWLMHCGQWVIVRRELGHAPMF